MDYDYNELKKYYNTRNYAGAINYLNQFEFEGDDAITVRNEINSLKRSAAIQESTNRRLQGADKEAYNFINGLDQNYIDRSKTERYQDGTTSTTRNSYGDKYTNYLNSLQTNDGKLVNGIAIEIDDKDALTELQSTLGIESFGDYGAKLTPISDGKYRLTLNKDNTNLYKILNALGDIDRAKSSSSELIGTAIGGILGGLASIFTGGTLAFPLSVGGAAVGAKTANVISHAMSDYEVKAIADGNYYNNSDFNYDNLVKAVDLVNNAKAKYDELDSRVENPDNLSEISVSGHKSTVHAGLLRLLANGRISPSMYEKLEQEADGRFERLINGATFSKEKVYVFGNEENTTEKGEIKKGVMLEEVTNTEAENIKVEILNALDEKRCEYQLATKDGKLGTMFTIKADEDSKNVLSDKFGNRYLQIFVENLGQPEVGEYASDTKTIAARTNADMKKIGYDMELSNGDTIGYEQGIPYKKLYNPDTKQIDVIPISEEEALQSLNESAIIDEGVSYILKNYDNSTGSIAQEGFTSDKNYSVKDALAFIAINAVDELYPKGAYSKKDRDYKKVILINTLFNKLPSYIRQNY